MQTITKFIQKLIKLNKKQDRFNWKEFYLKNAAEATHFAIWVNPTLIDEPYSE